MSAWEKVGIVVSFFVMIDLSYNAYAVYAFKNAPAQVKFEQVQDYIKTPEHNASIQEVSVASFLNNVSSKDAVYFTVGEKEVTAIVDLLPLIQTKNFKDSQLK